MNVNVNFKEPEWVQRTVATLADIQQALNHGLEEQERLWQIRDAASITASLERTEPIFFGHCPTGDSK